MDNNTAPQLGILQHLDPNELVVEVNVRSDASLTKDFVASVRELGVLVPVVAVRGEDGRIQVRAGQRRTLAAREAGLASIPVYLTEESLDTATRLFAQIAENDHRTELSEVDRIHGVQALLDTGLSVTKVAKKLAVSPDRVKASKAVAKSAVAMEAIQDRQVTLEEAAIISEFDGDENAVERLMRDVGRGYFTHTAERLRQEREDAIKAAEAAKKFAAEGYTVITERPGWGDLSAIPLDSLTTVDGEGIDEAVVADGDPAHWAVRMVPEEVFVDAETGEQVDETTIDFGTENDPDAEPEEGLRHFSTVKETDIFVPEFYCINVEAAHLKPTERYAQPTYTGEGKRNIIVCGGGPAGEASDARLAEAEAKAKAERRKLLALNKAGQAAETVRREWVKQLLTRKTPPKGAMLFVANQLAQDGHLLTNYRATDLLIDLLGANPPSWEGMQRTGGVVELVEALPDTGDGRAQVILLGLVLAALECNTPKDAWRNAHSVTGKPIHGKSADYLRFLAANGYGLAPVEEIVTGAKTADEVYEALEAGK